MKYTLSVVIFILGLALGAYFGFKKAPEEYIFWNSQFNASVLAYELEALKSEGSETILWSKELDLNSELANYGKYLESNFKWIFPFLTGIEHDPKHIGKAISYRIDNPFDMPKISTTEGWVSPHKPKTKVLIKKVLEGEKENKRLLDLVLNTHVSE